MVTLQHIPCDRLGIPSSVLRKPSSLKTKEKMCKRYTCNKKPPADLEHDLNTPSTCFSIYCSTKKKGLAKKTYKGFNV